MSQLKCRTRHEYRQNDKAVCNLHSYATQLAAIVINKKQFTQIAVANNVILVIPSLVM